MSAPQPEPFVPEGPQPLLREVPPGLPYPVHALGPLRAVVAAVQGMTGAPMAIPAQSALAVTALAAQGLVDVETLAGSSPTSLYVLTIAPSGERKSTCDAVLMKPLKEHEKTQIGASRDEGAAFQIRLALWKKQRDQILAESGKKTGTARAASEADLCALGPEPVPPPSQERLVSEPTFEGLTRLLHSGQPSLGLFSDEGGQFLGGHGMNSDNKQKTMAGVNDLWGGNPIRRTRAGEGSITLYGRRLSIHIMVQPVAAHDLMADALAGGLGFLPRFLICEPVSTIGRRLSSTLRHDPVPLEAFQCRLRELLERVMPTEGDEGRVLTPRLLRLSVGGRDRLVRFSDEVERRQAPGGDLATVTGYASKAAEQAARIAGVLTVVSDPDADEVGEQEMAWAIELAGYYLSEALRLAAAALISAETQKAEILRRWLLDHPEYDVIASSELLLFGPNSLREAVKVQATTELLVRFGWLVPIKGGAVVRGTRRKTVWRVVRP